MVQGALNLMSQVAMELHGTLVGQALFTKGIATQAFNLFNLAHKARLPVFAAFTFARSDLLPPFLPFSLSASLCNVLLFGAVPRVVS